MYQHINLSDEQISEKQLLKEHKSSNEIKTHRHRVTQNTRTKSLWLEFYNILYNISRRAPHAVYWLCLKQR